MSVIDPELFKRYNESSELNRQIIDAMVVRFIGISRYQAYSISILCSDDSVYQGLSFCRLCGGEPIYAGCHGQINQRNPEHAIKNTQTKSSKSAMTIQAGFKLALTGTPIQNHLGELWDLFNFCNPGLLGTLAQFTDRYVKNDLTVERNHLKRLITPFILRRTKNKVLDELPPKTEITYAVQLSDKERAFYEALRQEAVKTIENNDGPQGQQHLQALVEITKLRLACCNSSLVNKDILLPSAKLEAFFEILEELRASGHRALVFSQFVGHLSIVRKELDQKGIAYQYLDGSTSLPNRDLADSLLEGTDQSARLSTTDLLNLLREG